MITIPQLSATMQTLLTTKTEAAAVKLHYDKRTAQAKFTASTIVQTLVLGWLAHPNASVGQLALFAARVGVDVSPQAIDERLSFATAHLLQHVLTASVEHVITADPVAIPILKRFASVRVHDSTTIGLPDTLSPFWSGCGNNTTRGTAGLKCGVQRDLLTGTLCGLDLAHGRASDHSLPIQHAQLPVSSLRLADLGFYDLDVFAERDQAGSYWLSRLQTNSRIRVVGADEQSLLATLEGLGTQAPCDLPVMVGKQGRLLARLLVQRVPHEVADERRRRIRQHAKEKGREAAKTALALADWNVLITNVPDDQLSLEEAFVLMRLRWQIELLFKLWKSHGHVDEWRSKKPARILCEVYAKLLALVLQHGMIVALSWTDAERSMVKAAQIIRSYAAELANARGQTTAFVAILTTMKPLIRRLARTNKRKKTPTTAQRLLAVTT